MCSDRMDCSLAGDWDNVGLLVCPTRPRPISTILLTNDLTEAVVEEAVRRETDLLISYHPPLFRPFKADPVAGVTSAGLGLVDGTLC